MLKLLTRSVCRTAVCSQCNYITKYYNLYHTSHEHQDKSDIHVIDLRSDVLTQPTTEMRAVMADALLGDDVFRECPTTNSLERRIADMFEKEAALFVPTGTMGNLLSVISHCNRRGLEVILGDKSHIFLFEQGGISQLGGLHSNPIKNLPDGTFPAEEIDAQVRPDDYHYAETALICVEDTHNFCGGSVVPSTWLEEIRKKADEHGLPVHMDGARIMNAAVALNIPVTHILKHVDSVNMCFSKGLGAPVGSIIAGSGNFIKRALRLRKALGGGMRQPGVLAAAAHYALDQAEPTLKKDHEHAQMIAKALCEHGAGVLKINPENVHTNILMIDIIKPGLTAKDFCDRLSQISEDEENVTKRRIQIKSLPFSKHFTRIVLNTNISKTDVDAALEKIHYVLSELKQT